MGFLAVGLLSIYILYEFIAFNQIIDLPYISALVDSNFIVIVNSVALKWSLVVGVVGLLYATSGYFLLRDDGTKVYKMSIPFFYLGFALILSL